jgi:hypothetical protein
VDEETITRWAAEPDKIIIIIIIFGVIGRFRGLKEGELDGSTMDRGAVENRMNWRT